MSDKLPQNYPAILLGNRPKTLSELFSSRIRWGQGSNGQSATGAKISEFSVDAVRWCLGGGINLVYSDKAKQHEVYKRIVSLIEESATIDRDDCEDEQSGLEIVVSWNDSSGRTFKEIRQLVVKAGV